MTATVLVSYDGTGKIVGIHPDATPGANQVQVTLPTITLASPPAFTQEEFIDIAAYLKWRKIRLTDFVLVGKSQAELKAEWLAIPNVKLCTGCNKRIREWLTVVFAEAGVPDLETAQFSFTVPQQNREAWRQATNSIIAKLIEIVKE